MTASCMAAQAHVLTRMVAAEKTAVVFGRLTTVKACGRAFGILIAISAPSAALASMSAHSLTVMPECAFTWAITTVFPFHLAVQAARMPSRKKSVRCLLSRSEKLMALSTGEDESNSTMYFSSRSRCATVVWAAVSTS